MPHQRTHRQRLTSMEDRLQEHLDRRRREGTLRNLMPLPVSNDKLEVRQQQESQSATIDFASNDYLGLARCPNQHRKVQSAYQKLFMNSEDGSSSNKKIKNCEINAPVLGATGSRLLSGDSTLARSLESYLASPSVYNGDSALLFNSGYDANLSILSSLPYRNEDDADAIVMDELVHNSLVMGVRMGRLNEKRVFIFRHNDVDDLMQVLEKVHLQSPSPSLPSKASILIVVESVYSMDGDIAPLREILDVAQESGATVMVDEAHGLGVYGRTNVHHLFLDSTIRTDCNGNRDGSNNVTQKNKLQINDSATNFVTNQSNGPGGTGVLAALDLENHPALLCSVYTFGKAAGCHGAVVVGSDTLISYLVNYARPFVYSTALPPHSLVSIQQSHESMIGFEGEERRSRVFRWVSLFREDMSRGLSTLQKEFASLEFKLLPSPSPIQAVIVPGNERCMRVCQYLRNMGRFDVYPIRSPTVAKGQERIRIILHCHNKEEDVHALVKLMLRALKKAAVFPTLDQISKL